jgi:hypothetical protein
MFPYSVKYYKYYLLWVNLMWIVLYYTINVLWVLLPWAALFDKGVIGLGGRGASLEASPMALGLLGLGAGGRPGRHACHHLAFGLPGLER